MEVVTACSILKGNVRVLAVDDTPFERGKDSKTFLIGLMFRGFILEYAVRESVEVDGDDSTEALLRMVMDPKVKEEVRLVMTHGTTFAGLNVLDMLKFHKETGVPLIAVTSKMPTSEIERAIESAGLREKLDLVRKNPPYSPLRTPKGLCYYSVIGLSSREAEKVILRYSLESKVPEQLRMVDIIAKLFQGI
ncbi:MAG: DUF99 family protein [Candidatus Korarchaeum sp.]|nr:DUF99 family protein [Candidatus Korarchaeum sp.]MDW8036246.1 DUF99 family protein [Candidatus Korarchaeum sp.]